MKLRVYLLVVFFFSVGLHAQKQTDWKSPCGLPGANHSLALETTRLWAGYAPEAKGTKCEDVPTLTRFDPQPGSENGSAVVVLPGGAYAGLSETQEGRQVADWFTERGFTAFLLSYRLSSNGYLLPVPLLDARRAVQYVRVHAKEFGYEPNRIAIIGFSAGGHLAALAATQPVEGKPNAADELDRVSSRPDYLILGYAWIGGISSDTSHLTYCQLFNVMDKCEALRVAYSPDLFVTKKTPPAFLFHTYDDDTVPVEQALRFYEAMVKAGVPIEAHIFAHGPHGVGLGGGDAVLDQWPGLMESWLRAQGLLTKVEKK